MTTMDGPINLSKKREAIRTLGVGLKKRAQNVGC